MSTNHQETLKCSSCNEGQPFTVWDSINVSVDPQLKQSLLEGELTTFRCPRCGHEAHVANDCLYHDMDRSLAVWLKYPDDDGSSHIDPAASSMFSTVVHNYTCRLVHSFDELLDKIHVFEYGFSDQVIELLKLMICIREKIDISCPFHFAGVKSYWLKEKSLIFALETDQGFNEKRYPLRRYFDAVKPLMPRIESKFSNSTDKWPEIDRTFMLRTLETCGLLRNLGEVGL